MISLIAFVLALLTLVFPTGATGPGEPVLGSGDDFAATSADESADLAAIIGSWDASIAFPGGEVRETSLEIQMVAAGPAREPASPWLAIGPHGEALAGELTLERTGAGLHLASDARGSNDRAVLQGQWVSGPAGGHLEGTLFGVDDGRLFHWTAVRPRSAQ